MESWVDEVFLKWKSEGVKINIAASSEDITNAETILGFKFPTDFKLFYLKMNGFLDLDWQEHMFYFWPLGRIVEEFSESRDRNFIGFCDFLLSSSFIGFKKDQPGIFKMYSGHHAAEDISVAKTFEIAVTMINSSSDLIY
jgi:hypothetical protein